MTTDLRAKLGTCQLGSVAGLTFYNCGFMRYNALDWFEAALAAQECLAELGA